MTKPAVPGLAGLLLFSAISAAPAQSGANGVLGILSPSGVFRPLSAVAPRGAAAASQTVTGTLVLKLTITVVSAMPTSTPIQCKLDAGVLGYDANGNLLDEVVETATIAAARSGSQVTCTPKLPYQWALTAPKDTLTLDYEVTAVSATGTGRTSFIQFDTRSVPNNAATTTYSLTGRI